MTDTTDNQAEIKEEVKEETELNLVEEDASGNEAEEKKPEEPDYKEKFFYLAAEMENTKKRFDREKERLLKFGNEKIILGLLEVTDNLERTLEAIEKDEDEKIKNIFTGINMVKDQFITTLEKNGLESVKALGEIFDPNLHEALAQQPSEEAADQEILQVFQKGYTLNGRLIRAAKVIVAQKENSTK